MKKLKGNKGITLIALVITVIVLLILAAVSIATLTGENGLLSKTNEAKEKTEIAEIIEKAKIDILGFQAGNNGEITEEEVDSILDPKYGTISGEGEEKILRTDKGYEIKVSDIWSGTTSGGGIAVGEVARENTTIDGKEGSYSNPTIPMGFKAIETDQDDTISAEAKWGTEEGYQNGLVIEDATGDSTTNGSQFVWVPVENPSLFVRSYWENWSGNLEEEPEGDSWFSSYKENKETYEYMQMNKSVTTYGGFYVARYEARITNTSNKSTQDGKVKPVSKNNTSVWNNIPWGGTTTAEAIDGLPGDDTQDGAVRVARSMYPDTEKITEYALPETATNNTGVKSTLIYGVQWDAIMRWMKNIENSSATKTSPQNKYILDSTRKGNYDTNNPAATGTNNYEVKNIYDMAGNVYEWTMEAYGTDSRVGRGGSHYGSGRDFPASIRNSFDPDGSYDNFGFRVTLYL